MARDFFCPDRETDRVTDQIFGRRYGEFQYVCSSDQIAAKECFSDVDMYQLVKILYDADYPYMLMPDHAPRHPDDQAPEGVSSRVTQGWAFQFGYIIALIQAAARESASALAEQ